MISETTLVRSSGVRARLILAGTLIPTTRTRGVPSRGLFPGEQQLEPPFGPWESSITSGPLPVLDGIKPTDLVGGVRVCHMDGGVYAWLQRQLGPCR